jgi:peroxiredoxin
VFIGISVRDSDEQARRFVVQKGLAFPNGRDSDMKIARAYRVEGTPTTVLITPGGQILDHQNGTFPEGELVTALQRLLDYKGP